jgi:hypothetical protein
MACALWTPTASAATEAEKLASIKAGLAHLASTQLSNGSWSYGGYEPAATAASAFAFISQKAKWDNPAQYQTVVDKAIAYLLTSASGVVTATVSTRNGDGVNNICPGGSGSCTDVYWNAADNEITYTTGLIAPAIASYGAGNPTAVATTTGPLAGMTWRQISQGIINMFAASQTSLTSDPSRLTGGWRYYPGEQDSDSSTTQWAVISLIYGESIGATTPAAVKTLLRTWLINVQAADGSACYQPGVGPCDNADTGGWLLSMKYAGYASSDSHVQAALTYLKNNWNTNANSTWAGNFGHPYAMWATYKGLETMIGLANTTNITPLRTDCGASRVGGGLPGNPPGSAACTWSEDYNEWLVTNQVPSGASAGSWPGYAYWTDPLSTAFDVSILGAAVIPVSPTSPAPPSIPTLSEWGLAALGILLAGLAALKLRKAHARHA